jgi:hypothetical protein
MAMKVNLIIYTYIYILLNLFTLGNTLRTRWNQTTSNINGIRYFA